jgi:hypothetical protein
MRFFRAILAAGLLTAGVGCDALTEPNAITIQREPPRPPKPIEPPAAAPGAAAAAKGQPPGPGGAAGAAMPPGMGAAPKAGGG